MLTTDEEISAEQPMPRGSARETLLVTLAAAIVVILGYWWLIANAGYRDIVVATQFAGSQERLAQRIIDTDLQISLSDARRAMAASAMYTVLWGAIGWALLHFYWSSAWKAGFGKKPFGPPLGLALGLGAALIGVIEKVLTYLSLESDGPSVRFADSPGSWVPKAIVTLAWAKWLLAGMLILLVVAMLVSSATAAVRRELPPPDPDLPDDVPPVSATDVPDGIGICCSGGGIRAAGFALGALSKLEEEPPDAASTPGKLGILGRAKYLASVSGGGYAAAGWRIAAGTGELPDNAIIGDPLDPELNKRIRAYPEPNEPAADLVQHIRERRRYLSNGPGGLLRSGLIVLAFMTFHFLLLLLGVFVVAWPLGRIIVSWAITGDGRSADAMAVGLNTDIGINQWFPPVVAATTAVVLCVPRLALERTKTRRRLDAAIVAAAVMAVSLSIVLIVLPYAIDWVIKTLPEGGGRRLAIAGVYGVIVTAVWQLAKARLRAVARYLGGFLLAAGLTLFGLFVMAHAADTDEWFSSFWFWALAVVSQIVAFVFFNPDRWSLHGFYRSRLAGTFAAERQKGGGFLPHKNEPSLAAYRDASGPHPVICCAAARQENHQTGIPVLSMTFEPDAITVHRWAGDQSSATMDPERMSHAQFQRRLPRNRHGHHLQTAMGAAAISGAAIAPSLGRKTMKGTDALLAAFNARLGVWVPNPNQHYTRSTTPRLVNMFKEIIKTFDPTDPNVYATDGGHWENLGLVELIRRRCALIICIDASGDTPGSYTTLREAVKLANLECDADVVIDDESWDHLAVDADGVASRNFGTGTVTYADGKTATILYVKAAIMKSTPLHIQRYASADRRFPNYSTADQLLTAEELSHLIHLGYSSMGDALDENPDVVAKAMTGAHEPSATGAP